MVGGPVGYVSGGAHQLLLLYQIKSSHLFKLFPLLFHFYYFIYFYYLPILTFLLIKATIINCINQNNKHVN